MLGREEEARASFLQNHAGFQMIGVDFICPDLIIKKVCEDAKFIVTSDDFPVELRPELKDIFFSIITSIES